ncbi:hypothetical protein BB559_002193 [Furculomyces boomerangus]|uniref:4-hydroxy-3-methoxy-5-polyprenylbenzoate decarboxylase n=2 Tax=Harpellales TaxID=61421 RepID=A0A2T9YXA3_9FUNG|nr:hypothetical protein BB559_002193 [Furculomyces boomerangus]PVZ98267.1 hypothetical protein BB558_005737 [Smittium angustum]PWA02054.1 hypothetical protein BB558_001814 [Smittium angustum]
MSILTKSVKSLASKSLLPLTILSVGKGLISAINNFKRPDGELGSFSRPIPKYDSHIPTTLFQKATIAGASSILAISEPTNGVHLAAVGDITSIPFIKKLRDRMLLNEEGRRILKERPEVKFTDSEWNALGALPKNTFGYNYYNYMVSQNISWDTRTPVRFIDDSELAYVMLRHRQIHDFYHTVLGMTISILDELTVKHFEFVQTGLPVGLFAVLVAPVRLDPAERTDFYTRCLPWVNDVGRNTKLLMNT